MSLLSASAPLLVLCIFASCKDQQPEWQLAGVVDIHQRECANLRDIESRAPVDTDNSLGTVWQAVSDQETFEARRAKGWEHRNGEGSMRIFTKIYYGKRVVQEFATYTDVDGQKKAFCLTAIPSIIWQPDIETFSAIVGKEPDHAERVAVGDAAQVIWQWHEEPFQGDNVVAHASHPIIRTTDPNRMPFGMLYPGFYIVTEAALNNDLMPQEGQSEEQS